MNAEIWTILGVGLTTISVGIAMMGFIYKVIRDFKTDIYLKFDKIDDELNKIHDQIRELRTSLNRMEGAFYSKDCCMLKDDDKAKKAE